MHNPVEVFATWSDICVKYNVKFKLKRGVFQFPKSNKMSQVYKSDESDNSTFTFSLQNYFSNTT
jgi:hypothetical protein